MQELQAKVDAYDKNIDETLNQRIKDVTENMLDEYNDKLAIIEEEKIQLQKRSADQVSNNVFRKSTVLDFIAYFRMPS